MEWVYFVGFVCCTIWYCYRKPQSEIDLNKQTTIRPLAKIRMIPMPRLKRHNYPYLDMNMNIVPLPSSPNTSEIDFDILDDYLKKK